jgi:hypothetical protein
MTRAEEILASVQDAHGWREMLWTIILDDLESRDPRSAAAAHAAIRAEHTRALRGASTRAAVLAWSHLDYQARTEWLWACRFVQQIWIRGVSPLFEEAAAGIE